GNFFLDLDGRKFSTGANHAVFVSALADWPAVGIDAMRLYLAAISPHERVRNFDVDEFVAVNNDSLAGVIGAALQGACVTATDGAVSSPSWEIQAPVLRALSKRDRA